MNALLLWSVLIAWDVSGELHGETRVCVAAESKLEAEILGWKSWRATVRRHVKSTAGWATNDGCPWMPDDTKD